jgi:hypothetical protein
MTNAHHNGPAWPSYRPRSQEGNAAKANKMPEHFSPALEVLTKASAANFSEAMLPSSYRN